ncbi:MAG: sulfite exporter TauE/SafE family protein [Deltaproteobacteria bacterium]
MTLTHGILLFLAALVAGSLNSVAGGGSLISFPALIFAGISPIYANATSTVALWPGSVASVGGYRDKLPRDVRLLVPLTLASLLGGFLGAVLLLHTPPITFMRIIPWLFLFATFLFVFGKRMTGGLKMGSDGRHTWPTIFAATLAQLVIATYGGFFGGGMGILMLAVFSMTQLGDIHTMNGVKSMLAMALNGVAILTFVIAKAIVWPAALVMIAGAAAGGYGAARIAQRVPQKLVRGLVVAVGVTMALYFMWRY